MSETIKVDLREGPKNVEDNVTKVDLSEAKTEEQEIVQEIEETKEEEPKVELEELTQDNEEDVITLGEVSNDSTEEEVQPVIESTPEADLPENVEKLVDFMKETGGTLQDYVRLNADYSNVDSDTLLTEYYKQTKSHLDAAEIDFLMEDSFFLRVSRSSSKSSSN